MEVAFELFLKVLEIAFRMFSSVVALVRMKLGFAQEAKNTTRPSIERLKALKNHLQKHKNQSQKGQSIPKAQQKSNSNSRNPWERPRLDRARSGESLHPGRP